MEVAEMPQEQRQSQQRLSRLGRAQEKPMAKATEWTLRGMGVSLFVFVMIWQGKVHIFSSHTEAHSLAGVLLELAPAVVLTMLAVAIVTAPERTVNAFFGILDKVVGKFFPAKDRRGAPEDN
jgi:hypothetical protein